LHDEVQATITGARLLVNATALGLVSTTTDASASPASPIATGARLPTGAIAYDLNYGRRTPFLMQAEEAGCRTLDGLEMLILQGAASFRLWTGMEPDIAVMRVACARRLEENTP
jgi:shikimate dehydrogenase